MRRLFAFLGMLIGIVFCSSSAFAAPITAINALKNETLIENHMQEPDARHMHIGDSYTIRGVRHEISTDTPNIWTGCRDYLEQTATTEPPAQPAPIIPQAAASAPASAGIAAPQPVPAVDRHDAKTSYEVIPFVLWFIEGLLDQQFVPVIPSLMWFTIGFIAACAIGVRLTKFYRRWQTRRRSRSSAHEEEEIALKNRQQLVIDLTRDRGTPFAQERFVIGYPDNEDDASPESEPVLEPAAAVWDGPIPSHIRSHRVAPRLANQPRLIVRAPPVRPRR